MCIHSSRRSVKLDSRDREKRFRASGGDDKNGGNRDKRTKTRGQMQRRRVARGVGNGITFRAN